MNSSRLDTHEATFHTFNVYKNLVARRKFWVLLICILLFHLTCAYFAYLIVLPASLLLTHYQFSQISFALKNGIEAPYALSWYTPFMGWYELYFFSAFTMLTIGFYRFRKVSPIGLQGRHIFFDEEKYTQADSAAKLQPCKQEEQKQKLVIQLVHEIAIAAGMSMPTCKFLPKCLGINAFCYNTKGQEIIVVTEEALEQLSRDELQSLIAHEIGHIAYHDREMDRLLLTVNSSIFFLGLQTLKLRNLFQFFYKVFSLGLLILKPIAALLALPIAIFIWIFLHPLRKLYAIGFSIQEKMLSLREHIADALAVEYTRQTEPLRNVIRKIKDQDYQMAPNRDDESLQKILFAPIESGTRKVLPNLDKRLQYLSVLTDSDANGTNIKVIKSEIRKDEKPYDFIKTGLLFLLATQLFCYFQIIIALQSL